MDSSCPLCSSPSKLFFEKTYTCSHCLLVFKSSKLFLSPSEEAKRYQQHNNVSGDQGYIDFLNKLATPLKKFLKNEDHFLDYGCGPFSQISKIVEADVGSIQFYDPLFFPEGITTDEKFDVVTCTEVAEHFRDPEREWDKLVARVKPNGILGIMTQFYSADINYKDWWYKNDPTHIVFYCQETLEYLAQKYHMKILYNDLRSVIIFQNGT